MPEAEWNDERTKIICELFEEQVRAGNRPNTHLNNVGYRQVAAKFQQRTQLLYTKLQLKNKWDKFKGDYITWKKLLIAGAGLPWDAAKGTFVASDEWWKNINKELPGARRFRNGGLQHEDKFKVMFDYITSNGVDPSPPALESPNNGVDHLPPAATGLSSALESHQNGVDHSPVNSNGLTSGLGCLTNRADHSPPAPESLRNGVDLPLVAGLSSAPEPPLNGMDHSPVNTNALSSGLDCRMNRTDRSPRATHGRPYAKEIPMNGTNLEGSDNNAEDIDDTHPELMFQYPSNRKKRPTHVNASKKSKKSKAETALLMQTHLSSIVELAQKAQDTFEKFSSQAYSPSWPSIQDVMTLVLECGARCGSNEHFIATELFVSREQREMFLTMETAEERFQWLRRKYIVKYLSGTGAGPR